MPVHIGGLSLMANTSIKPSSIVSFDTTGDHLCRQATGATDAAMAGIAQVAVDAPPNTDQIFNPGSSYTPVAAASGEELVVYYVGDVVPLILGAGGCNAGQFLTSDANGYGITASAGNYVAAKAIQTGNAGDQVDVVALMMKI